MVLSGAYSDYTSAYRFYTRPVLESVLPKMESRGFAFLPELVVRTLRAGFKVGEVKIQLSTKDYRNEQGELRSNVREYARFLTWRYFG